MRPIGLKRKETAARTAWKKLGHDVAPDVRNQVIRRVLEIDRALMRPRTQDTAYRTLTTTLPFARPFSTYANASLVDSNAKTRSTTGRMIPESMREAISRNWSPLALMKRNEYVT